MSLTPFDFYYIYGMDKGDVLFGDGGNDALSGQTSEMLRSAGENSQKQNIQAWPMPTKTASNASYFIQPGREA